MRPLAVNVGGVRVAVASSSFALDEVDDSHYRQFSLVSLAPAEAAPDIRVDVVASPPEAPAGRLLFDCDGAWSAFHDDMGYRIVMWSTSSTMEHFVARSNADTSRVVIHIGESWGRFITDAGSDGERLMGDPFRYPIDQLILMNHLATRSGLIVHSAGLEVDGAGLVFPGASQAGKTTLSNLLTDAGLGEALLSDDRMILRADGDGSCEGDRFSAWGTPWPGDAGVARNACVPLRALFFLVQDESPAIVPLAPAAGARRMFPVISCPWWDRELVAGVLDTIERLVAAVPCYEFHFRRDQIAVEMLRRHAATLSS